jgi:hypothetical protein
MEEFIPALIVLAIGTPLAVGYYYWYRARWFRKHGRAEDVFIKLLNNLAKENEYER